MTQLTRDDLPVWMQNSLRGTDWGVLIVLAFSLLAAWPFLLQPGLPRTNASEHYVYRAADTAQAFGEGRLYPRWSPNALTGYGAPIPQYYPPSAAFAPALIDFFITGDPTLAVKLVYALALCLAGAAVYAFVARRSGAGVGVIAALLYIYSPYVGLTAPHLLGDLPGVISLALIPALLWSADRLLRANRPFDFPTLVLITAALLLTDVRAAFVGWVLVVVLLVWDRPDHPRRWFHPLGAGLLGTLLAAYFWLPVLAEADAVQWIARTQAAPDLLTLVGLFAPLRPLDPGALIPAHQLTLGLALPIFALLSLIARHRASVHYLFLALGLILIVLALVIFPSEVWLLGVITLCLSIGGSALVTWRKAPLLLPVLAVLILVTALPVWLAPRWSEEPIDASPLGQVDYEQQGYGIAVLPDSDPLPTSILPDITPDRALIASYRAGLIDKAQQISNAQIGVLEHTTYGERFQVQTTDSITLHILTPYFPGWTARLNDAVLNLTRSDDGLIDLNIPNPTRGELEITLDTTSARTAGWAVAWLALLILIAITLVRARRPGSNRDERFDLLPRRDARLLSIVLLGFGALLALSAIPSAPLSIQPPPNYALAGSRSLDNRSDAGLEVLAYRLDTTTYYPGSTINLTLYWHTLRFLADNYQVRVSLLDLTTGAYRQPTDLRQPGGYPTTRWLPRAYVADPYALALPTDFPAGNYSPAIEVCTGDCTPETRLTFFNGSGTTYGPVLVLPIILTVE